MTKAGMDFLEQLLAKAHQCKDTESVEMFTKELKLARKVDHDSLVNKILAEAAHVPVYGTTILPR